MKLNIWTENIRDVLIVIVWKKGKNILNFKAVKRKNGSFFFILWTIHDNTQMSVEFIATKQKLYRTGFKSINPFHMLLHYVIIRIKSVIHNERGTKKLCAPHVFPSETVEPFKVVVEGIIRCVLSRYKTHVIRLLNASNNNIIVLYRKQPIRNEICVRV